MKEKRKICFICKAKKFKKYLEPKVITRVLSAVIWVCKNKEKCKNKGFNYGK